MNIKRHWRHSRYWTVILLLLPGFSAASEPARLLPDEINRIGALDRPVVTPDEKTLYFYKQRDLQANLWTARRVNGIWRDPVLLEGAETRLNELVNSVSANGNMLLIQSDGYTPTAGGWDLYYRRKRKGGWGPRKTFPDSCE